MLLSDDEVGDLTRRRRPSAQVRVLRALGIEHKIRPDNSLIVLRSHVEHLLGGTTPAKVDREEEPNWSAVV